MILLGNYEKKSSQPPPARHLIASCQIVKLLGKHKADELPLQQPDLSVTVCKTSLRSSKEILVQRGPTTGPRNNFAQFKSCRSQAAATLYNKAWRADEFFFFFGERYDFGTKIGISEIDSK